MSSNNNDIKTVTVFTDYDIDNYLKAIDLLYSSSDTKVLREANKFLMEFEKQITSWTNAILILKKENLSNEAAYFIASNILKVKLKYDFVNFCDQKENCKNLAMEIFEIIEKFKNKKFYILSNICSCFAIMIMLSHKTFPDIFDLIDKKLGSGEDLTNSISLLLIFSYFAEFIQDKDILIEDYQRESFKKVIFELSEPIFKFIIRTILDIKNYKASVGINNIGNLQNNIKIDNKALIECLYNWFRLRLPTSLVLKLENEYADIIDFIFDIDDKHYEAYSECICKLLQISMESKDYLGLCQKILRNIISFNSRVKDALNSDNEEEIVFFIDIYQYLCENNLELIHKENRLELIEIMSELSKKVPVKRIHEITDFWQRFLYFLSKLELSQEVIMQSYGKIIANTLLGLMKYFKYDDDIFVLINQKKKKEYKNNESYEDTTEYREILSKFFEDFANYFSFNFFFQNILLPQLNIIGEQLNADQTNIHLWACLEALFYCFSCIAPAINIQTDNLPLLYEKIYTPILNFPKELKLITKTCTFIINETSLVLGQNKELLVETIKYVLAGLNDSYTLKYCTKSLKILFSNNSTQLNDVRGDLLFTVYYQNIKDKLLDDDYYFEVLEGLVEIISASTNIDEIKLSISFLLSEWTDKMKYYRDVLNERNLTKEEENVIEQILDIFSFIVKQLHISLGPDHNRAIFMFLFNDYWSFIQFFFSKFQHHHEIVEILTQSMKSFLRSLGTSFNQFLQDYLNIIINGYNLSPIATYLYAFEVIMVTYINDNNLQIRDVLVRTLEHVCRRTLEYLPDFDAYETNIDLSDDFFGLLERTLRTNPIIVVQLEIFDTLTCIIANCLLINHVDTAKNVICYLHRVIDISKYIKSNTLSDEKKVVIINKLKCVVHKYGQLITEKIVQCIMVLPPETIFESVKELGKDLMINFPNESEQWFTQSLQNVPEDILTLNEKTKIKELTANFDEEKVDSFFLKFVKRCLSKKNRSKHINTIS